jgi:hypothetical protein
MSSANWPMESPADRQALERALTVVAEESFFAMVDPTPDTLPPVEGEVLAACVDFSGSFTGTLCCGLSRALARQLTAAFSGAMPDDVAINGPEVTDLAGEFANMVCGRWLTDVAPRSLFTLARPMVVSIEVPPTPPVGLLNGHPIWIAVTLEK